MAARALVHLAGDVAVVLAHGVRGRHGVIRQLVVLGDLAHERGGRLPIGQLLAQERVEHGAGRVERLQLVLHVERAEDVVGEAHRQMRRVRVVRLAVLVGRDDIRELLLVVLGEAVRGALGRRGLEVVQVAVLLLVVGQAGAHVVEHVLRERLRRLLRHVGAQPAGVQARLVHAHEADGAEVVLERAQVALRVRVARYFH